MRPAAAPASWHVVAMGAAKERWRFFALLAVALGSAADHVMPSVRETGRQRVDTLPEAVQNTIGGGIRADGLPAKLGVPADIGNAVALLCSRKQVDHGQILDVDGAPRSWMPPPLGIRNYPPQSARTA